MSAATRLIDAVAVYSVDDGVRTYFDTSNGPIFALLTRHQRRARETLRQATQPRILNANRLDPNRRVWSAGRISHELSLHAKDAADFSPCTCRITITIQGCLDLFSRLISFCYPPLVAWVGNRQAPRAHLLLSLLLQHECQKEYGGGS